VPQPATGFALVGHGFTVMIAALASALDAPLPQPWPDVVCARPTSSLAARLSDRSQAIPAG